MGECGRQCRRNSFCHLGEPSDGLTCKVDGEESRVAKGVTERSMETGGRVNLPARLTRTRYAHRNSTGSLLKLSFRSLSPVFDEGRCDSGVMRAIQRPGSA